MSATMRCVRASDIVSAPASLTAALRAASVEDLTAAATLVEEAPPANPKEKALLIRALVARLGAANARRREAVTADRITVHPAKPAPPATTTCTCKPKEKPMSKPKIDDLAAFRPPDPYKLADNPEIARQAKAAASLRAACAAVGATRAAESAAHLRTMSDRDRAICTPPDSWGLNAAAKKSAA